MWVNLDKTADDIDKCLRPWWTKWIAALPPEQREALADYKSKNYPLFAIAQDPDREFSAEDLVRFEALDAALAASPQLPSPIVVWRGFARYRDLFTGETTWNPPALGSLPRFKGFGYAVATLAFTALVPLAALALTGIPDLSADGVAVGLGALFWSCLLESATLTERTRRMNGGVAVIGIELWLFAVLFVVADLLLLLFQATETFGTSGALWAAAVGASFVALADLASASVGLAFAAANRHPLADP